MYALQGQWCYTQAEIIATIPITVHPKQSARFRMAGRHIISFQAPEVVANAREIGRLLSPYRPPEPWSGAVGLSVTFCYPWPKSWPAKRKVVGYRIMRPDCENLVKQLNDVFQAEGFFKDDAQVAHEDIAKRMVSTSVPYFTFCLRKL